MIIIKLIYLRSLKLHDLPLQVQSTQKFFSMDNPQQSPLSYPHASLLFISSQKPSPTQYFMPPYPLFQFLFSLI